MVNDYYKWLCFSWKYMISKKSNYSYRKEPLLSIEQTNQYIYDKILSGEPFWVGRFGGSEMNMMIHYLQTSKFPWLRRKKRSSLSQLCSLSGFFPKNEKYAKKFLELMINCSRDIDLVGTWNLYMEDWFINTYVKRDVKLTRLVFLEPWKLDSISSEIRKNTMPWSAALRGKKVLVVHPFENSIRNQYMNNRENIFRELDVNNILPEFELITLKAVQTLEGENTVFDNWFDALQYMYEKIQDIEFDVAIVGCGAYGFPLAAKIKQMGKGVIHLGGATQLMFGIIGKRWEKGYNETCTKMINQYWVRPLAEETITMSSKIEGGCYW